DVNAAEPATTPPGTCPSGATCTATLVHETSSIVYDATDSDATRVWKVFVHSYVVVRVSGQAKPLLLYPTGHISMHAAKLPSGPWSSAEPAIAWPGSDVPLAEAKYRSTDDMGTQACGAFGEPGATVAPDGTLHLALACIHEPFDTPVLDIVLLRSS